MPSSKVMQKFHKGTLRSGGKGKGHPKVEDPMQAVAIMYSERRKEASHGGRYPHHVGGLGGEKVQSKKEAPKKKSFAKNLNRKR